MAKDWIDRMTYAEFEEGFSVGDPQAVMNMFYLAPNETKFSPVIERIKEENGGAPLHLAGVIGGSDMGFHYISTLDPEMSFMFDIAIEPVHYLGLRLCAFEGAKDIGEYFMNLRHVDQNSRKKIIECGSIDVFLKMLRDYEPNPFDLIGQGMDFARKLGYGNDDLPPDLMRMLTDADFRKKASIACINYFGKLRAMGEKDPGQLRYCWQQAQNFRNLKKTAEEGRIRGFHADFFRGFSDTAETMIEDYGIKNLVLYISNIPEGLCLQLAHDLRAKGLKAGDAEFNKMVSESAHDTLDAVLAPLAEKVDKLWVVESHYEENRIIGRKR